MVPVSGPGASVGDEGAVGVLLPLAVSELTQQGLGGRWGDRGDIIIKTHTHTDTDTHRHTHTHTRYQGPCLKQCLQFLVIYKLQNGREIEMHREMLPPSNQISLLVSRSPRSSHGGPLSLLQSIQHHSTVIGRRQDPIFDGSASRVACSAQRVTDRRHQVLMHPKHRRAVPTS